MIKLLDGRTVTKDYVRFEPNGQRFYYGAEDVTNSVSRADKVTFRGFDVAADNRRLSQERITGVVHASIPEPLEESTMKILTHQLATDPLGAPLEVLDNTTKKILGSFGIQIGIVAVAIGLFLWMGGLDLIKGVFKKP